MKPEAAVRVRILRVAAGQAEPSDIDEVFADLRFVDGRPPQVRDLADFAAHRHARDRGPVFDNSNALFASLDDYLSGRATSFSAAHAYDVASVVDALCDFLIQLTICSVHELADHAAIVTDVALFALSMMHGCELELSTGHPAVLALRCGSKGLLEIGCAAPIPTHPDRRFNLSVFKTGLSADRCLGRLLNELPPSDPTVTIERTSDGHLRYLE